MKQESLDWRLSKGKINLCSTALAHTSFSSAVVTDRDAVQPRRRQLKPTHMDFYLCCHRASCSPSLPFKWSPPP